MVDGLFHFYKTTIARRKNKLWEYNGPELTSNCILVTSPPIKHQFSKEGFEWQTENHGEHPIKVLLTAAIQLGIQQGINLCSEEPSRYLENDYYKKSYETLLEEMLKKHDK